MIVRLAPACPGPPDCTARTATMPMGPKGEKRPADAIGDAMMIGKIAVVSQSRIGICARRHARYCPHVRRRSRPRLARAALAQKSGLGPTGHHAVIPDEQFGARIHRKPLEQRLQFGPQPIAAQGRD
jgi:hypothetical protein